MGTVTLKKHTANRQPRESQLWAGWEPNKFPPQGGQGRFFS
jgi:hypothetical protein